MEQKFFDNSSLDEISNISFDLAIFACGYEKRSSFLALQQIKYKRSICFFFENEKSKYFQENYKLFENALIPLVKENNSSNSNIISYLSDFFERVSTTTKEINILVDYSSMSRIWYASIVYFLKYLKKQISITIFFSYSIPKYEVVKNEEDTILYEPVEYISQISVPDKPTALIIGLGDMERQAIGLKEYFDAEEVYCYYAYGKYSDMILEKNKSLINTLGNNRVMGYPLKDIVYLKFILESLCREQLDKYRIVIAPCGPKTFTLASFIVSASLPAIDVWRISKPQRTQEIKEPSGEFVILKITYEDPILNSSKSA